MGMVCRRPARVGRSWFLRVVGAEGSAQVKAARIDSQPCAMASGCFLVWSIRTRVWRAAPAAEDFGAAHQIGSREEGFQPGGVLGEPATGQVAQPGGFGVADASPGV